MLKLLLLAVLMMVPDYSQAASRKLGSSDSDKIARSKEGTRETDLSNKKTKCKSDEDCPTDFTCRHGYCGPNFCQFNAICDDDQYCDTTTNKCTDLDCSGTIQVGYSSAYKESFATVSQIIENHQCKSCHDKWTREDCPCEQCTELKCTLAATGCIIGSDGYTKNIVCATGEIKRNGECVSCSDSSLNLGACTACHYAGNLLTCDTCAEGTSLESGKCVGDEVIECTDDTDCETTKMCKTETRGTTDSECIVPPSLKDPDQDCQTADGEYISDHRCHTCTSGCARCHISYENDLSGKEKCDACADGYEFDHDENGDTTSCVETDCSKHNLATSCTADKIATESESYPGCYTCLDPVAAGVVSCEVGELYFDSLTSKYCCKGE